mmetsp:Transcript_36915/g.79698  ORF Transcript_36915/g.79698 Transcript_36915/m.79698 type:complete len:456 (-) Transcript_36915:995-2362(-)
MNEVNEATKRVADVQTVADASHMSKKTKIDVFEQQETGYTYPPAVSFQDYGRSYKYDTDGEGDAPMVVAAAATASSRKPTTTTTILTFATGHDKFARLQLLSTHTLYDLVATLCKYTPVGCKGNEGPDDHLWHVNYRGHQYQSRSDYVSPSPIRANKTKLEHLSLERGSLFMLTYDYGTTSTYQMTLLESRDANDEDDLSSFPRNQLKYGIPVTYQKYQPPTNCSYKLLDAQFSYLNDWIFHNATSVTANLFQAGRKKNYGFMDNKFTMMYLPTKPDNLANWLECFNRAASTKPAGVEQEGYTHYTWQSIVPIPRSNLTQQLINKYKSNEKHGFCDAPIVEDHASYPGPLAVDLQTIFPKIAALAGLRKDKRVPKGWISFNRRKDTGTGDLQYNLVICKGNARESRKSKAPKGLAFEGENQHESVEEPLFQISNGIEVRGLHDLFCVVEGLLRTL